VRKFRVQTNVRLLAFDGVGRRGPADDFAAQVGIAVIGLIVEASSAVAALGLVTQLAASLEAGEEVGLVQSTDGVGDVVQFRVDSDGDFAEADDHADHQDREDESQFGGDNSTAFVVEQFTQHGQESLGLGLIVMI